MQNIILAIALLLFTAFASQAQCDKKVKWHATSRDIIDSEGKVVNTKPATITIETSGKTVSLDMLEYPDQKADGVVKEVTCNWTELFKNGTAVYNAVLTRVNGDTTGATITIEAKDGKITLTINVEKARGRIVRMNIDKYEEVK